MPIRTRLVSLLLFASGFCALLYQTTWLREFRLIFGASTAASAAVVGVFMAGIGFGGIFLGRRSEAQAQPLVFYGRLELYIAGTAALSPLLILAARQLYVAAGGTAALGIFGGTVVRLLLTALILGPPTFLMGGTLPAAARAAVTPDDATRQTVGFLYGMNTLGAVLGAVSGTFFFFEHLGNRLTLWSAAALNVAVALLAFAISKATKEPGPSAKVTRQSGQEATSARTSRGFILAAAGLVGFAFFLMELVWYRMLGPLLGGSTFSFGLILSVALLGIGSGGVAYALIRKRRAVSIEYFALTCAAEAFFIALPYAWGDRVATWAMLLRALGALGFHGHVVAWSAICGLVVFPAAFIAGLQFPLLIALLGRGRKSVGSETGAASAWNTVGALLGSLAGGFGLLPLISAPGVWRLVTLLLCGISLTAVIVALRSRQHWSRLLPPMLLSLAALLCLTARGPTAFWRHSQIGVGRLRDFQISPNQLREMIHSARRQVKWERDGFESSVALTKGDSLAFFVNGKSDGSATYDAGTQIMAGLIGAALHPHPRTAFVVGLGTGSTAGWLAALPEMERVNVVELEPTVLKVAEECAAVNRNALHNSKLHVTVGDGREALLTCRERFDIIVSEPSNPYRAGVANLFTREYYASVERHLQPGGLFCQWVQAYEIDDRTLSILYQTLGSVFRSLESWQTQGGDLLLVASRAPISYDATHLRDRLNQEPFRTALRVAWQARGLEDFLAHYVGNAKMAEELRQPGSEPLNTDDRTVVEFAFARTVSVTDGFQLANLRISSQKAHTDRPVISGDVDWLAVDEARLTMYPDFTKRLLSETSLTSSQRLRGGAFISYAEGDLAGAVRQWRAQAEEPKTLGELGLVAEGLAAQGDNSAAPYIDTLKSELPLDARAIVAELNWTTYKPEESIRDMVQFFEGLREDPWPSSRLVRRSLVRAETIAKGDRSRVVARGFYEALREPFSTFVSEKFRLGTRLALGLYSDGETPGSRVQAVLKTFEPDVRWERRFLELRRTCYELMHDALAGRAERDLREFLRLESSSVAGFGLTIPKENPAGLGTNGLEHTPGNATGEQGPDHE